MKTLTALPSMMKEAFTDWREDNAPRLGAALSYYTIFSIAPVLLIAVAVAGLVFGEEAAQGGVVDQIEAMLGATGADAVRSMLLAARKPGEGVFATIAGVFTLLVGASGAFNELRGAMNTVWEVKEKEGGGIVSMLRERLLSFAMVMVLAFLLLVSLIMSAGLAAMDKVMGGFVTEKLHLLQVVNLTVSLGVVTVLFAMIFKILPDADPAIAWKDVWIGAFMTAILFTIGKLLIGLYLGRGTVGSAYGAAGSLVIILVWVYYASQILFFGAELTQVYASRMGSRAAPTAATVAASSPHTAQGKAEVRKAEVVTREPDAPDAADATEQAPRVPAGTLRGAAIAASLLLLGYLDKARGED